MRALGFSNLGSKPSEVCHRFLNSNLRALFQNADGDDIPEADDEALDQIFSRTSKSTSSRPVKGSWNVPGSGGGKAGGAVEASPSNEGVPERLDFIFEALSGAKKKKSKKRVAEDPLPAEAGVKRAKQKKFSMG